MENKLNNEEKDRVLRAYFIYLVKMKRFKKSNYIHKN